MTKELKSFIKKDYLGPVDFELVSEIAADKASISEFRFQLQNSLKPYSLKNLNLLLVAFDEVITNIAEHGLGFDNERKVKAGIYLSGSQAVVVLEDNGNSFDPRSKRAKSPKKQFAKGADGGYGMYIYKRVFQEIDYSSSRGVNHMVLYFHDKKVKIPGS